MDLIMGIEKEEVPYPDVREIYPYDPDKDKRIHTNTFTESYLKYIEDMNPEWINGIYLYPPGSIESASIRW
jgi:hypothetical protein